MSGTPVSALFLALSYPEDMMQSLDKKELAVFTNAQPDYRVHLQERYLDDVRKWALIIESPSTGQVFSVVTALGKTRLFKNADTAIDFIKETCPNNPNKAITVTYGDAPS
ncbi:hypothetical protein [Pseudomonas mohnii]